MQVTAGASFHKIPRADLDRLVSIAHEELMRFFKPDCCVMAARVLIDVLARLNVKCMPVSVMAAFYGKEMDRHVTEHGCDFWSCREKLDVEAAIVMLGTPPSQRREDPARTDPAEPFNGHVGVVVLTDEGLFVVDLTVEQASHPEHGVPLDGPLCSPVNLNFVIGRAELVAQSDDGITVRYVTFPNDHWYAVNSPDWSLDTPVRREFVESVFSRFNGGATQYSDTTLEIFGMFGRV